MNELIEILSDPSTNVRQSRAKAARTCKICDQPADHFRDATSEFEYLVSTICQDCQDKYFKI